MITKHNYSKKKMNRKNRVFKIVKKITLALVSAVVIFLIIFTVNKVLNTRTFSEKRAHKNAVLFVNNNHIDVKRLTCAGDTVDPKYKVRDGYGSCSLVTVTGEKIMLQCPTDFLENLVGARGCKEFFMTLNITSNTSSK
jgi:hypothetical protein